MSVGFMPAGQRTSIADNPRVVASVALVLAVLVGAASAVAGPIVSAFVAAVGITLLIAARPEIGAYLIVGLGPLIVGVDRGKLVPALRLNEVLLGLVAGAVVLRGVFAPRARVRLNSPDVAVVALAVVGAVVPSVVRYSRVGGLSANELLSAILLVKVGLAYAVIRSTIRTPAQVRRVMLIALVGAMPLAAIGVLQSLNLFGLRSLLANSLLGGPDSDLASTLGGRGTTLIGSSIGAAGYYAVGIAINLSMRSVAGAPRRLLNITLAGLLLGLVSTAQFTAFVAVAACFIPFLWARRSDASALLLRIRTTRSLSRIVAAAAAVMVLAVVSFGPRFAPLLGGKLPDSWQVRWYNLSHYFLPPLGRLTNLFWGVSPVTQIEDPRKFVRYVWIESGYVWLLYTGGVALLLTYFAFVSTHWRSASGLRAVRQDEFAAAAVAAKSSLVILAVLMVFDQHLTLRGSADMIFPILAMAATGAALSSTDAHSSHSHLALQDRSSPAT